MGGSSMILGAVTVLSLAIHRCFSSSTTSCDLQVVQTTLQRLITLQSELRDDYFVIFAPMTATPTW